MWKECLRLSAGRAQRWEVGPLDIVGDDDGGPAFRGAAGARGRE